MRKSRPIMLFAGAAFSALAATAAAAQEQEAYGQVE